MTKPFFTIPTFVIFFYFMVKGNYPLGICFLTSYGAMDCVGILHDSVRDAFIKTCKK